MKKVICLILCVLMAVSALAGCASKPKTFKEAAELGKTFVQSDDLKNVKVVTEGDDLKFILEGKYDPKNGKALLDVSFDLKDTVHTFKEMLKLDGNKLYIKIPDMSVLEGLYSGFSAPIFNDFEDEDIGEIYGEEDEAAEFVDDNEEISDEAEDLKDEAEELAEEAEELAEEAEDLTDEAEELADDAEELLDSEEEFTEDENDGYYDDGLDGLDGMSGINSAALGNLAGKYVMIKLPETKMDAINGVISDAEELVYDKAEKADGDEKYPYVVKYNKDSAYDLIIAILDGVKVKKNEISSEIAALVKEYIGEESFRSLEEMAEKTVEKTISEGIDSFFDSFKPEDIKNGELEDFEVLQKIAYDSGKKLEYVFTYDFKNGEEKHSQKTTVTITNAEKDDSFADRCTVAEEEVFDLVGYLKNVIKEIAEFAM